jgi:bacterioferritin-associated ferredoxin
VAVTRCVCREVPLSVVARAAAALRAVGSTVTLAALSGATRAGTGCGTCRPYMARAAITGESVLPVMGAAEGDAWVRRLDGPPRA